MTSQEHAAFVREQIAVLDTLEADEAMFRGEAAGPGGPTWAMERYAESLFIARQMARIVRPLLEAYETADADTWLREVKNVCHQNIDRLVRRHGRHNSTSVLQNAINEWEAEAMSRFVEMCGFWLAAE